MDAKQIAACTGARIDRAESCAASITEAMALYGIDTTPKRIAMFLSNIGVETGGLKWFTEIWGPTEQQNRYEGRLDLGNTQPGDGELFKGHGMLQSTGRKNHALTRDRLRVRFPEMDVPDFEVEPWKLAEPEWAALSAGDFIERTNVQVYADQDDFDGYCDKINRGHKTRAYGDANDFEKRKALYEVALKVLA